MIIRLLGLLTVLVLAACAGPGVRQRPPLQAAPSVDLARFMGTWHVIAHVPYFFEKNKVATRDEYRLRPDGRIDNDFVFKKRFGEEDRRWRGVSSVVPGSNGARWKVQFVWPFSTELVVVQVDDDYEGAALVTPKPGTAIFCPEPNPGTAIFSGPKPGTTEARDSHFLPSTSAV